jgi:UDP-3-O-[3-hydroxymyristoyl] N-acetylglucosamine deacetylase
MTLRPAPPDTGIVFRRTDLPEPVDIPVRPRRERRRHQLGTTLVKGEVRISTVEHLLSAFAGLGIDNAYVDLSAPKCRSWTAAPARSCSCCSPPASRNRTHPKRFIRIKTRARRGRRQVGAVRSVRRLQGQLRDRVRPPDLQAPQQRA